MIISKIRNFAIRKPTLVTFGLSLAITMAIGAAIGMLDYQQASAFMPPIPGCRYFDEIIQNTMNNK